MSLPAPYEKFLSSIHRRLGSGWPPLDPVALDPPRYGVFVKRGDISIRAMYDARTNRFYLALTNRSDPQEKAFYDDSDPELTAAKIVYYLRKNGAYP